VAEGDSFWSVAERFAAEQLGRTPTVGEVTTLWADLLQANADNLTDPGNPNLILPGQVMVFPAS
jgi:hypothetical protein